MTEQSLYTGICFAATGAVLAVGRLPGRKRYALYCQDGAVYTPLAYFRNEDAAAQAGKMLDLLANGLIAAQSELDWLRTLREQIRLTDREDADDASRRRETQRLSPLGRRIFE